MSERVVSAFGLVFMLFIAWLLSENRRNLDWRLIITGILLQIVMAVFLLTTVVGQTIFAAANSFFTTLVSFANEGAGFVFGKELVQSTLAFSILPTIIFIATLSAILFHLGILQWIIGIMSWVMAKVMNISGIEALTASANVYLSMTESPLLVRPYLSQATRSELFTIMTAGMATIAGGVMAAYVKMGASAGHLLTTSLMSAPAAIVIAKIMVPETQISPTKGMISCHPERESINIFDAACTGATDGLKLALNVGTMLLAAVSLIYMLNWFLSVFGPVAGEPLTLQRMLGWGCAPLALVMGVPACDIFKVGVLLGEKTIFNEFIAYVDLTAMNARGELAPRSFILAQYALCSFANLGSIAILVGGISQLVPERRKDFAQLAFRSLIAGTLAGFCTACIAGVLIE